MNVVTGPDGCGAISDSPYKLVAAQPHRGRSVVRAGDTHVGGGSEFMFIAGPCAVESAAQVEAACEAAVQAGATMLRGDLYKHRTSPYAFQGLGAAGAELIAEQRRRFGLPWVAEVLAPEHLEVVADIVDVVRIGTRNMQNFELLKECARSGKTVMLKRGLAATVDEWLLAAEYIATSGTLDIVLCERGIRTYETATRNTLDLSVVPLLKGKTHLPVVVDPSHGTGNRALVAPMALAAVAAGADGVMIDVHPHPDHARCDGPQALLPDETVALGRRLRELAHWTAEETPAPLDAVALPA
jgi:3-deoxy-7-phosphoheptulonate synthase